MNGKKNKIRSRIFILLSVFTIILTTLVPILADVWPASAEPPPIAYSNVWATPKQKSLPSLGEYGTFYYLGVDGNIAFCLDFELSMSRGTELYHDESIGLTSKQIKAIKGAVKKWIDVVSVHGVDSSEALEQYCISQIYIWTVVYYDISSMNYSMIAARAASPYLDMRVFDEFHLEGDAITEFRFGFLPDTNPPTTWDSSPWGRIDGVQVTNYEQACYMYESYYEAGGSQKVWFYNNDEGMQRLVVAPYKVGDWDPAPDKPTYIAKDDTITSKMFIEHNINGTIDQNTGKGVVAKWRDAWRDDENGYYYSYCTGGSDISIKTAPSSTDTVTVPSVEGSSVVDYNFIQNQTDINQKDGRETYTTEAIIEEEIKKNVHWDKRQETDNKKITDHDYYRYTAIKSGYDTEYYYHKTCIVSYDTFKSACAADTSHTIAKPIIRNFQLTINYQGGWYTGVDVNTNLGEFNNSASSYDATRNSNGLAANLTSTQKTIVELDYMDITESLMLNTTSSANPASDASIYKNSAGNWIYEHGSIDGVRDHVEFFYKGYYLAYMPTPQRWGYNFLGYYDADGNKITPKTITVDGITFTDVYVFDEDYCGSRYTDISGDQTLYEYKIYAHWELVTKDETFTIQWLDNSNNYTTRPDAVYVELHRWPKGYPSEVEICSTYITERLNTSSADWIDNFSNETGKTSSGNSATSSLKTSGIYNPNSYEYNYSSGTKTENTQNNIFKAGDSYWIKVKGNNSNPAGSNTWTFTLKDLQKTDTTKNWVEYEYVIKEVVCESLDTTTQYYVSPNPAHNTYNTSLSNYYNIKDNLENPGGQGTLAQYNALDIPSNFTHTMVNRAGNTSGNRNQWKDVSVTITFKDGPVNSADDDIYHFRPYAMKIDLYQNYPYGKDSDSDNFLTNNGVRILYDTKTVTHPDNPYSASIPSSGILANTLMWTFKNIPTLQDNTCIKIAYDVILTHGQDRYRYTIDVDSEANNLVDSMASSHYYANKHKTDMQTITDLNYKKMYNKSTGKYITVLPYTETGLSSIEKSQVNTYIVNNGYEFVVDNYNDIYQNKLKQEDYTLSNSGQNNRYSDNTTAKKASYSTPYQSMAYNLRYYYIDEERNMLATPTYDKGPSSAPTNKKTEYLQYEETLYWNFTLTLNHSETKLPTEYSGSESSDDRTGVYTGGDSDDFMHTKNTLVISNKIYADKNQTNEVKSNGLTSTNTKYDYYDNLITESKNESFLITLKQVKKSWLNSGNTTTESYDDTKFSKNGYKSISYNDANGNMTINFVSNASATASNFNEYEEIGNEYNIQLPAHGTVIIDYIPDGRYEVTCHYDIDFDYYTMTMTNGTVTFEQGGNEKWYITISSTPQTSTGDFLHKATVDYWRGYVDDENEILSYKSTIKQSEKNSWLNGEKNGFNVKENFDEEHPDSFYDDFLEPNYKTGN